MKINGRGFLLAGALVAVPVFAQQYDSRQVTMVRGDSDHGKCTIDIVVDGVVEVEVRGTEARMRTLSGTRATWRRFQCNQPFPDNPNDFHFAPQEGRGRQTLLRSPQDNRGTAVVHIEDPQGGSEGYKFDLEWNGSSGGGFNGGGGGNNGGGFGNNGGRGDNFPGNGPGGVIQGPGPAGWNNSINFSSAGNGVYRNFRGGDDSLQNATVNIERNGRVHIEITSSGRNRYVLEGRLISADSRRLSADVEGGGIRGTMDMQIDRKNRITQLSMVGNGRDRFELRWQAR